MKIQEETDVKEYQIRKKKSREQIVENMENKEKEVRETEPETTKEEDEHVKEMGMLSLDDVGIIRSSYSRSSAK